MARFTAAVKTSAPETLSDLARGQWIDYEGTKGRWIGRTAGGSVWIAWGRSATDTRRFSAMCAAFKAMGQPYPRRTPPAPVAPVQVPPSFEAGMIYSRRGGGGDFFVMSGNAETVDVWEVHAPGRHSRIGEMTRHAFARALGR